MIDNRTPNYSWPLIHPDNDQEDDVPRLLLTLLQIDALIASIQLDLALISPEAIGALPVAGTAVAAERLATARRINGVLFNGTQDITISTGEFVAVPAPDDVTLAPLGFAQITNADAPVTVSLPAAPEAGQEVMVGNLTGRLDHRIAVDKINGRATDGHLTLNKAFVIVRLRFISADYGWSIL
ncbi:hypothetical protein JLK41_12285 [Ectopseudomonas khazarica]|uniref:hypothetical protein n=1 Tax=Ectopseudomonas khazarica TaxID=2502979 RepID=UPI001AEF37C1|nr:hypothetical protein [Pseudomonas khazarica]QTS88871.1 hypothetical protein JLK41_12285 [Pseudomonas khazarica]